MHEWIRPYKFMAARRTTQITLLFLLFAGNAFGWKVWVGNLSASRIADTVPLSDPYAILQMLAAGVMVPAEALTGAVLVLLFFGIMGGRVFCSWVCPMNMVTDLANRLRKVCGMDASGRRLQVSRNIRYWVIGLSLGLSMLLGVAAFEWISPVSMLHRGIVFGMGLGWAAVLAVFLLDLLVIKNGFCGHLCPLGGFYAIVGRYSLVRMRHQKEKCTLCMKCVDICPEPQVLDQVGKESTAVLSGECNNCGRCVEVCDDNAICFGLRTLQP